MAVLQHARGRIPQHVDDRVLHAGGQRAHLRRLGGVADRVVGLRRGEGSAVDVGGLGAVEVAAAPVERDRVGVVAGQRAPVVLDQPVVVVVVVAELALGVALGVLGEVRRDGGLAAVDLIAPPGRLADVLGVAVGPVGRVTGIVEEPAALGDLPDREPVTVGVERGAQVLQVVDVHRLGERDGVVVPERALDRGGELVGLTGHVGVEVVEPHQPPAVVVVLLDGRLGRVEVRDVLRPPQVVRPYVGGERGGVAVALVGVVLAQRLRDLVGDEAHHDLGGDRGARGDGDRPVEPAAGGGEPVARQARVEGGEVVERVDGAGQLVAAAGGGVRRGGPQLQGGGGGPVVGDRQVGHGDVVLGDELGLLDPHAAAGVHAPEVARRLPALAGLLGEGARRDRDGERALVVDALDVGHVAGEAERAGVVGLHEQRAAAGHQDAAVGVGGVAAGTAEQPVDPEVGAGALGVVDGLHHVAGVVADRRRGHGGPGERGVPDGLRRGRVLSEGDQRADDETEHRPHGQ